MIRALIVLLFLGAPAMAKDTPIVPQSKLGTVVPNDGDEYDRILERLDAGDVSAWDDYYELAERSKVQRKIMGGTSTAPQVKNGR